MNEHNRSFNVDFSGVDLRNEDAFLSLYDHFSSRLLRHATARLGSSEEAKDIVSQVFLKAWEYIADEEYIKKPIKNPKAFLYQIANNQIIDAYRKKSRTEISLELFAEDIGGISDEAHKKTDAVFDAKIVLSSMASLRQDYKELLLWRYLDDLSIGEISHITGKSRGSVSVMLYRALGEIKRIIKIKGL